MALWGPYSTAAAVPHWRLAFVHLLASDCCSRSLVLTDSCLHFQLGQAEHSCRSQLDSWDPLVGIDAAFPPIDALPALTD